MQVFYKLEKYIKDKKRKVFKYIELYCFDDETKEFYKKHGYYLTKIDFTSEETKNMVLGIKGSKKNG